MIRGPFIPRQPKNVSQLFAGDVQMPPVETLDQLGIRPRIGPVTDNSPNTEETNRFYTPPTTRHDYHRVLAGTNRNVQLGFTARSVRISNYTSLWAWIECLNDWVPPNMYAIVAQIPSGTQNSKIAWEAPPNRNQPVAQTTEELHLTWVEDFLMPSPGIACPST